MYKKNKKNVPLNAIIYSVKRMYCETIIVSGVPRKEKGEVLKRVNQLQSDENKK